MFATSQTAAFVQDLFVCIFPLCEKGTGKARVKRTSALGVYLEPTRKVGLQLYHGQLNKTRIGYVCEQMFWALQ